MAFGGTVLIMQAAVFQSVEKLSERLSESELFAGGDDLMQTLGCAVFGDSDLGQVFKRDKRQKYPLDRMGFDKLQ
jgi:hypothetical protein